MDSAETDSFMSDAEGELDFVSARADRPAGLQMAPLIDIVFLLICFYMLVAQLITNQKDASVLLPAMANPVSQSERPAEIVINLRADDRITVDGRVMSLARLEAVLADQLARARRRSARPAGDQGGQGDTSSLLRVVVRADRRQRFGRMDQVLAACRKAGITQVVLRARKKR